jgi:hypothetical protein
MPATVRYLHPTHLNRPRAPLQPHNSNTRSTYEHSHAHPTSSLTVRTSSWTGRTWNPPLYCTPTAIVSRAPRTSHNTAPHHRLSERELTGMLGEMSDPGVQTWSSAGSSSSGTHDDDFDLVLKALCPDSVSPGGAPEDDAGHPCDRTSKRRSTAGDADTGGEVVPFAGRKEVTPGRLDAMFQTIATGTVIPSSSSRGSQGALSAQHDGTDDASLAGRVKAGADSPPTKRSARRGFAAVFGRGKNKCPRH